MNQDTKEKIQKLIDSSRIVLFMKGTPQMPQCGFSMQVVNILRVYGIEFTAVDVLADEEIRQGIKEFSNWPTIPQLYVEGKFIGGCDILTEMSKNGELEKVLKISS